MNNAQNYCFQVESSTVEEASCHSAKAPGEEVKEKYKQGLCCLDPCPSLFEARDVIQDHIVEVQVAVDFLLFYPFSFFEWSILIILLGMVVAG